MSESKPSLARIVRPGRERPMIAMIHRTAWYNSGAKLKFQKGCELAFENSDLDANAQFIDEPIDYIFRNQPYDYQQLS